MRIPLVLVALASASFAQDKVFPPDAVVNVVTAYGAKPDDGTDDTAAIQKAITENVGTGKPLYFPAGVYDIDDSLVCRDAKGKWEAHITFQGQSREKTVLKLAESAKGFDDRGKPKALLLTGSHWNEGDSDTGGGNKAFRNNILDLTLDTGEHPGAIGIEWANSNWGAIEDVRVIGTGFAGIAMKRSLPGPGLIKNVIVEGFDIGIDVADVQYGVTIDNPTLRGQETVGIRTDNNLLHVRGVRREQIQVTGDKGVLTLIDGHGMPKWFNGNRPAMIPIEDAPGFWNADLADWAAVGPRHAGESDDTPAIQRAIDSGKSTVYLPIGRTYFISDTLVVRGKVKQVLGQGAEISLGGAEKPFSDSAHPRPLIRIDPTEHDTVFFEHLFFNAQYPGEVLFENNSPKTVVIRHSGGWVGSGRYKRSYRNTAQGTGKLFVEDVFLPGWEFRRQTVFARQFNPENQDNLDGSIPQVLNVGGKLSIIGFKTEGQAPFIVTRDGGITDVLGAYNYISATAGATVPESAIPYVFEDSTGALSFVADNYRDSDYLIYVRQTRNGRVVVDAERTRFLERPGLHKSIRVPLWWGDEVQR